MLSFKKIYLLEATGVYIAVLLAKCRIKQLCFALFAIITSL